VHDVTDELLVRVHRPNDVAGPLPCVYAIHGGGYVMGDPTMMDHDLDRWCQQLSCVGVSIGYRLAPETPYPGPLDDCLAGLSWTLEHADELGIDPDHIGVVGGSAGGGLAAALALRVRDEGELSLSFQLLECPMLDDRQETPSSQLENQLLWDRDCTEFGWRSYLGDLYGTPDVPYLASPARCSDLRGLPPTFISVGGADGFRDEATDYAIRLAQAGVPTELHVLPGAPHGVAMFADTWLAQRFSELTDNWLGRQLCSIPASP